MRHAPGQCPAAQIPVAGDTGIAPVRSIVLHMLAVNDERGITVLYEPDQRHILYAGDFASVPGKLELTVLLTRLMLPFLTLVAIAAALMGMLNSLHLFFIPALVAAGNKTSISIWLINFRVTPETLLLAFAVSVGVGVLAGFGPAIRSSRSNIVDGLRQVV